VIASDWTVQYNFEKGDAIRDLREWDGPVQLREPSTGSSQPSTRPVLTDVALFRAFKLLGQLLRILCRTV